ncbi:hypothetical protein [Acinetobacter oleivorans]|uniref:Uncharacterized protein n=1 Tax=Acinetobacter oleivorans (strain JCM 16667 / KCTC 23045 / DR1) TaxID=436717 RepID=A0AAN0UCW5_ACISD|nr:hypothetical protein [Acinetobacter oleivorans]ADI90437.1 hypothetical protein AOLE_07730 [Acinetobacter oleivorans DR1]ESK45195.1 hypothetical protein P254_00806 [Acinetobacter oleivorans CIP 110421]
MKNAKSSLDKNKKNEIPLVRILTTKEIESLRQNKRDAYAQMMKLN